MVTVPTETQPQGRRQALRGQLRVELRGEGHHVACDGGLGSWKQLGKWGVALYRRLDGFWWKIMENLIEIFIHIHESSAIHWGYPLSHAG